MPRGIYPHTSELQKKNGFKKGNQLGKNTAGGNHGNWKGGVKYQICHGITYKKIRLGVRKYIFEHRYIMEQHLGRKLTAREAIHHKDGNGLNNSLVNLLLVSWGEHKNLHKGSYLYPNFKCKCGNTKHFAKSLCETCYSRRYARIKYGWVNRKGDNSKLYG